MGLLTKTAISPEVTLAVQFFWYHRTPRELNFQIPCEKKPFLVFGCTKRGVKKKVFQEKKPSFRF